MKIVVLDGYVLNPGDISWAELERIGELTIYERTSYTDYEEISAKIGEAEAVITNKVPFTAELLARLPHLKYIGVTATGYNIIDLKAAKKQGIIVTNIPAYSTDAVAQFAFSLLLEVASRVGLHDRSVHAGEWAASPDFSYFRQPLMELAGKTIGLIGWGNIAQATARIAHAFKMEVIFYNHRKKAAPKWADQVELSELYQRADVISLHIPQTNETTKMIDRAMLEQVKPTAILLNTARGGLIDEAAVAEALTRNRLAAYCADVVTTEPILADNPLLSAPNCILTPHIAWAPIEARKRLMKIAADNLASYASGTPQNVVNN